MNESTLATAALWSYGIATAGFAAFAMRLALGWHWSGRATLLFAVTLASALWAASGVAVIFWPVPPAWFVTVVSDLLRYALWFAFVVGVLSAARDDHAPVTSARALPLWLLVMIVFTLAANLILTDGQMVGAVPETATGTGVYGARLGLAILGLVAVEQLFRRASPQARWAVRPLCLGLVGIFAFDVFYYGDAILFGRLDPEIWVARGIANAIVIPLLAVATARNPRWAIDMHMSRSVVFHSSALLVSGVFLFGMAAAGFVVRYLGGEWGRAIQIVFLFTALLAGIFVASSGRFRSNLRVLVSKHFFSYRYDYREEWLRFTRHLSAESSLLGVRERTITALADLVESPGGLLWLRNENVFKQASRCNMPECAVVERDDASLVRFFERTGWVVNLHEYASDPTLYPDLEVPEWMARLPSAWLVIPLAAGADLIGFVVLADARVAIDVNWEVLDLLKTASSQAASYLGHVRATETLLEARKFDAFNRMSAFVVHDLKNLVAQLSLMLRNAERHHDNPEFQRDMLVTVENVVGRMNKLMLQLRIGATPVEKPHLVDLEHVVRQACAAKSVHTTPIKLELAPGISTIGHEDQLDHVIGHLVQNALDATANGGTVTVRLGREDAQAVLEVADTGVGMTPEFVRDRLFRPFETSKSDGMGIGVYESSQYVAKLGGQIFIDSKPNDGTRVRVLLPIGDDGHSSSSTTKAAA